MKKTAKKSSPKNSLAAVKLQVARDIGDVLGEMVTEFLAEHDEDLSADLLTGMNSLDNVDVMRCLGSGAASRNASSLIDDVVKEASEWIDMAMRPIVRAALIEYVKQPQALPEYADCSCTGCKKVRCKSKRSVRTPKRSSKKGKTRAKR